MSASDRADVYSRITGEIVSAIENGAGEWRMPWHHDGNSIARPRNVTSGNGYRGINILALWAAARRGGYASGIWGTYQQWSQLGGQVRRGEKATTVVLWKIRGRPRIFHWTNPLRGSSLRRGPKSQRFPKPSLRAPITRAWGRCNWQYFLTRNGVHHEPVRKRMIEDMQVRNLHRIRRNHTFSKFHFLPAISASLLTC